MLGTAGWISQSIAPAGTALMPGSSSFQAAVMVEEIFSATIIDGKLVFAQGTRGKIDASTTRSDCTPRTRPSGSVTAIGSPSAPIRQEQEQCQTPTVAR